MEGIQALHSCLYVRILALKISATINGGAGAGAQVIGEGHAEVAMKYVSRAAATSLLLLTTSAFPRAWQKPKPVPKKKPAPVLEEARGSEAEELLVMPELPASQIIKRRKGPVSGRGHVVLERVGARRLKAIIDQEDGFKATFVYFWSTDCQECIDYFPVFQKIQKKYASSGIRVLLVSLDKPAHTAVVRRLLMQLGFAGLAYTRSQAIAGFASLLGGGHWPGTVPAYMVYQKGKQVAVHLGKPQPRRLSKQIRTIVQPQVSKL